MSISIIIPNYNGSQMLLNCIASIYSSNLLPDEIIVVDNASHDNSHSLILSHYPNVHWIQNNTNLGFSVAVNQGIKASKCEFTVLLNNDTEVSSNWLQNLSNHILSNTNIFSCSSKMIQYYNRNLIDDVGDYYTVLGWAYKAGDGENIKKYSTKHQVFSACAGAAIYRKKIFDEIGFFDETFFAYLEDVDIGYRARHFGYVNEYCADAYVYHIGSATTGSKYNDFKIKNSTRNNIYLLRNNMPILFVIINSPFLFLGILIKGLYFVNKGFIRPYLDGLYEGITTLKNKKPKFPSSSKYKNSFFIQISLYKYTLCYLWKKIFK